MKQGKQIHIRLPDVIYRKLKVKCAVEARSVQDYLAKLIEEELGENPGKEDEGVKGVRQDALALLQESPLFTDADTRELKKLANLSEMAHFRKGSVIFNEEELSDSFRIVARGLVTISKVSQSGKEFIIDLRGRGERFGKMPLIDKIAHYTTARAIEDTDVLSIPKKDFLAFLSRNPAIMTRISGLEMSKVSNLYGKLIDLVSDRTDQRVNKILHSLSEKHGNILSLTHNEIAKMTGTTNETATRILTGLKNHGIVKLSRGRVVIIDKERLLNFSKTKPY